MVRGIVADRVLVARSDGKAIATLRLAVLRKRLQRSLEFIQWNRSHACSALGLAFRNVAHIEYHDIAMANPAHQVVPVDRRLTSGTGGASFTQQHTRFLCRDLH